MLGCVEITGIGMATQADVRRIALALPATEEREGRFAFAVRTKEKLRDYAWVWVERIDPKKPRVPNNEVLAVRTPKLSDRDAMISAEPAKFFTEPHYSDFPAVLVRLAAVLVPELHELLSEAWKTQAPKGLVKSLDAVPVKAKARQAAGR
jgi:hypothetical protein